MREIGVDAILVPTTGGGLDVDDSGRMLLGRESDVRRLVERDRVAIGSDGVVHVEGGEGADTLAASLAGGNVSIRLNGQTFTFAAASVRGFLIDGGDGNLIADIAVEVDVTLFNGDTGGDDSIRTAGGRDSIAPGGGNDTVDAGNGRDYIFGGFGNDLPFGGAGNDKVFGESNNDVIHGGTGDDRLDGGSPFQSTLTDQQYFDGHDSISGNAGRDTLLGGIHNDRLAGGGGRDRIFGGSDNDRLYGGANGDWIYGETGIDKLFGEAGDDLLYGGAICRHDRWRCRQRPAFRRGRQRLAHRRGGH